MLSETSIQVKVNKDIPLYTFTSFVADFGGYLGLLLGASLLSIFDDVVKSIVKLFSHIGKSSRSRLHVKPEN